MKKWILSIILFCFIIVLYCIDGRALYSWYVEKKINSKIKNNDFDDDLSGLIFYCFYRLTPDAIAKCIRGYNSNSKKQSLILLCGISNRQDMIPFLEDVSNIEKDEKTKIYALATAIAIQSNIKLPEPENPDKKYDHKRMKSFSDYLKIVYLECQKNTTKSVESIVRNVVKSWNAGEYQINDKTANDTENEK